MSETRPPVDGLVIHRSKTKTFVLLLLAILAFPIGCGLIWARVQGELAEEASRTQITVYGLVVGVIAVLGSPVMIYQLMRSLWVRRRFVVGADRIQILENVYGKDVVVFQIPYANIASVAYEVTSTDRQMVIDLINADDPETYAAEDEGDFKTTKNQQGHHYCTYEAFQGGPHALVAEIQKAMKVWAADRTPKRLKR